MFVKDLDVLYPLNPNKFLHPTRNQKLIKERVLFFIDSLGERLETVFDVQKLLKTNKFEEKAPKLIKLTKFAIPFVGLVGSIVEVVDGVKKVMEVVHENRETVLDVIGPTLHSLSDVGESGLSFKELYEKGIRMTPGEKMSLVGHNRRLFIQALVAKLTVRFRREISLRKKPLIKNLANHFAERITKIVEREGKKKEPPTLSKLIKILVKEFAPNPLKAATNLFESFQEHNNNRSVGGYPKAIAENFLKCIAALKANTSLARCMFLIIQNQMYQNNVQGTMSLNLLYDCFTYRLDERWHTKPYEYLFGIDGLTKNEKYNQWEERIKKCYWTDLTTKKSKNLSVLVEQFEKPYSSIINNGYIQWTLRDQFARDSKQSLYRTTKKFLQLLICHQTLTSTTEKEREQIRRLVAERSLLGSIRSLRMQIIGIKVRMGSQFESLKQRVRLLEKKIQQQDEKIAKIYSLVDSKQLKEIPESN